MPKDLATPERGPKILILDIETSPSLAYIWSLWDENTPLQRLVEVGNVMCFAAKWRGEKKVHFYSAHHDGHFEMVKRAHQLISEADAVVHFNGRSFDMKHLQREFMLAGLSPASPHKDIDLLTVCRSKFKFLSNKLQHISEQLGLGSKEDTGGFDTWKACMAGDEKAWKLMRKYNIQDVHLTEQVYERLLPWIDGHPHWGLYTKFPLHDSECCQRCGSKELVRKGFAYTGVGKYQRFKCAECGGWSRGKLRVGSVTARSTH